MDTNLRRSQQLRSVIIFSSDSPSFYAFWIGKSEIEVEKDDGNCSTIIFRLLGYEPHEDVVSFPRVDADAKIKPEKVQAKSNDELKEPQKDEESSGSENEEEGEDEKKKKRPKEKIGFRDRKVSLGK